MPKFKIKNKENTKRNAAIALSIAVITIAVLAVVINNVRYFKTYFRQDVDENLTEVSKQIANIIDERISNYQTYVMTSADAIASATQIQGEWAMGNLKRDADRQKFSRYASILKDGQSLTTDGFSFNAVDYDFLRSALSDQKPFTAKVVSPVSSEEVIIIGAPVIYEDDFKGFVSATMEMNTIESLMDVNWCGGEGFLRIINSDGDIVVGTKNQNAKQDIDNFFEILENDPKADIENVKQLESDLIKGEIEKFNYSVDGEDRYGICQPLSRKGWYLVTCVPISAVNRRTNVVMSRFINLAFISSCSFVIILIFAWYSYAKSQNKLLFTAYYDKVTDGYNGNWFEKRLVETLKKADNGQYCLVSLDVERFKVINDIFGKNRGNMTLKYIYNVIKKHLNPGEFAARENADMLNENDINIIAKRLESITADVNKFNIEHEENYVITLMCGIYIIDDTAADPFAIKDRALVVQAKAAKQNYMMLRYAVFVDSDRTLLLAEKEIENRQDAALENEEFVIYMQPKYSLETQTIYGYEALVRWNDPVKGILPPSTFIPIFERNGFIVQLDNYVFTQVCKMFSHWQQLGREAVPVSINLSRTHIARRGFLSEFSDICRKYGVPTNLIEIELTETIIVENISSITNIVNDIHQHGFTCSMDDFGSGYSSLNVLKDVPVDVIKLDRGFFNVKNDMEKEKGDKIVKSVIDLAHQLKMHVVCEGVEDIEQLSFLMDVGCDYVQGYVYSRPVTTREAERMLDIQRAEKNFPENN